MPSIGKTDTVEKHQKRALFLHIQKTAGSGIVETLRVAYGSHNVVSHGDYLQAVSHFPMRDSFRASADQIDVFQNVKAITGHFGFDFARRFLPGRYSFTFLREPCERILSFYYFCLSRDPREFEIYRICQTVPLEVFLNLAHDNLCVRNFIWNNQAWQLFYGFGNFKNHMVGDFSADEILRGALVNIKQLDRVGFVDTFVSDRATILRDLGINNTSESVSVANKTFTRPRLSDVALSTQKTLMSLTELDRELYGAARRLDRQAVAN